MRVRPMQREDLGTIVAIEQCIHVAPWTRGNFSDALAAGYDAWLFEADVADWADAGRNRDRAAFSGIPAATTIGYAVVMWLPDEVHLLNLGVCAGWQGRGRGRSILLWLLNDVQARGAGAMMLEVRPSNARAAALYDSLGFEPIGRRRDYYPAPDGREDALVLRKRLGSS